MKTEEDEAFEAIERRQNGFQAKRAMAADKLQEDRIKYGTSWEKDGERIDPTSVYKEPVTERKALKLALEALDSKNFDNCDAWCNERDQAITAIKEALAQPAQEPVATFRPCRSCGGTGQQYTGIDEAPTSICKPCNGTGQIALAQPEQEPAAWRVSPRYEDSDGFFDYTDSKDTADTLQTRGWTITPLYAQPYQLAQEPHGYDWSMLEAAKESLREHMARIKELEAALKLALEALEGLFGTTEQFEGGSVAVWRLGGSAQPKQAIIAIKEALAQPWPDLTKREWVGLTDEETSGFTSHEMTVVKYVSKVLQEKNHG